MIFMKRQRKIRFEPVELLRIYLVLIISSLKKNTIEKEVKQDISRKNEKLNMRRYTKIENKRKKETLFQAKNFLLKWFDKTNQFIQSFFNYSLFFGELFDWFLWW